MLEDLLDFSILGIGPVFYEEALYRDGVGGFEDTGFYLVADGGEFVTACALEDDSHVGFDFVYEGYG